ncbi:unnamed protein product [Brassica oleracea]
MWDKEANVSLKIPLCSQGMAFSSTGLAILPLCDGEALDPPPPPCIAPPASVTTVHDSSSAAVQNSSVAAIHDSFLTPVHASSPFTNVDAVTTVTAITDVDVFATVVDVSQPPKGSDLDDYELDKDEENTFLPSLGAWLKPLNFTPPPTPPEPATPRLGVSEAVNCRLVSQSLMVPRLRKSRSCSLRKRSRNCL